MIRSLTGSMTDTLREGLRVGRHAQLVWFDPGVTTGVFVCSIRPRWLEGDGEANWSGLGSALTMTWFGQIGREARIANEHRNVTPVGGRSVKAVGFGISAVLDGQGRAGGGVVSPTMKAEIEQLLQQIALLEMWPDAAWGYESFTIRRQDATKAYSAPIRINARIEAIEVIYGARGRIPFVQEPSYAKSTATDDRMKMAGLYRPGMPHATDAARHAATFLRDARKDPDVRARAWPKLFGRNREESTA